jgi:rubredoxin
MPGSDMNAAPDPIVFEQWICTCCGYVYDPATGDPQNGIPPGTPFEQLPADWHCPVCYALKKAFEKIESR